MQLFNTFLTSTWLVSITINRCLTTITLLVQAVQKEREEKLAKALKDLLNQYVRGDKEGFLLHAESEARRLSDAGIAYCLFIVTFVSYFIFNHT